MIRYAITRMMIRRYSRRMDCTKYRGMRNWEERAAAKYIRLPEKCRITPVEVGSMPAEWLQWQGSDAGRIILYLHGGGYVLCSPRTHRDLICRIARASGARALSIEYRRGPEHPYPAAVDDAVAAYQWLLKNGTDPKRIAVMGDSAGGGLTLVLLQTLRDRKILLPACAVCLSPWTDLTCSGDTHKTNRKKDPLLPAPVVPGFARLYLPEGDLANPSVSPLFGDFANLPPILIHVGTDEILLDDSRCVADKAQKTGASVELKIWPRMIHVFQALAFMLPVARQAIREIGAFVERHIP
jgi:epsilon-lactone hydrolase